MRNVLMFACMLLSICACNKNTAKPVGIGQGTITATIGGVSQTFTVKARAALETNIYPRPPYSIVMAAAADGAEAPSTLLLTVNSTEPINTKTYLYNNNDKVQTTGITYEDGRAADKYTPAGSNPESITITIQSITETGVQGTFSGTLSCNGQVKKVTNGRFNLALSGK